MRRALWVLAIGLALGRCARAEESVGPWGDPAALVFEGNAAFTAGALVKGLTSNLDFVLASHPAAPLAAYPDQLRKLLTTGYHQAGFVEPRVSVELMRPQRQVRVTIDEGVRCLAGEVQLVGHDLTIPFDRLQTLLTTPQPKAEESQKAGSPTEYDSPAWQVGKPVAFTERNTTRLKKAARRALEQLGYWGADFDIVLAPQRDRGTAELQVNVREEGPVGRLGEIVVLGGKINTPRQVLDYLNLRAELPFDQARKLEIERALWQSARFVSSQVTLSPPDRYEERPRLTITLKELADAPPLGAELPPAEAALLRYVDWCNNWQQRGDDWVITLNGASPAEASFQAIVSTHGLFFEGDVPSPNGNRGPRLGLALQDQTAILFSPTRGRRIRGLLPSAQRPIVQFHMRPLTDEPEVEQVSLDFKAGLSNGPQGFSGTLQLRVDPVCALINARRSKVVIEGEQVSVTRNDDQLRFATQSGRLIEYVTQAGEYTLRLAARPGALREAHAAALAAAPREQVSDPARPLHSLTAFVLEEWAAQVNPQAPRDALSPAMRVSQKALAVLDRLIVANEPSTGAQFYIPAAEGDTEGGLTQQAARLAMGLVGTVFPPESWPWTATREAALVLNQKGRYTPIELQKLLARDEMGPLGYWSIARLTAFTSPHSSKIFAAEGLKRLSRESFERDARLIAENDRLLGRVAREAARFLGELEPDELDVLVRHRTPVITKSLRACAQSARENQAQPDHEQALRMLAALWSSTLQSLVQEDLQRIAR